MVRRPEMPIESVFMYQNYNIVTQVPPKKLAERLTANATATLVPRLKEPARPAAAFDAAVVAERASVLVGKKHRQIFQRNGK